VRKAASLRPQLIESAPSDLGVPLGRATCGLECWSSVEDSLIIVGPPRSGKGLHLVVPQILDAPGAVVTTSTRPDNLTITLDARSRRGPVALFDPQGLADGVPSRVKWSPLRGCEHPDVAMARARALSADAGAGVESGSFWSQQSYTAVRCLLHAAALDGRQTVDLVRWSLSPLAAEEASEILARHPRAAPAWATALDAILQADPRQRDSTWAMVANAFAALADPRALATVSPADGEDFDPAAFLRSSGTLYLLGTATGASASANLIAAFVEDIVETARRLAAAAPRARLEPPLSLMLDEAANYPLPSLLPLMSEGGGSGIATTVVLQSLAQARARWGNDEAAAIWDAANKIVLGGSSNATDLRDLSALLGSRTEKRVSYSHDGFGRRTATTSTSDVPVYEPSDLRTLRFGSAVLLFRSLAPIQLQLRPWTARKDRRALDEGRRRVENLLQQHAAHRPR
jgi:type IV secretory pathway TraG/TraD family ATPase VirD4